MHLSYPRAAAKPGFDQRFDMRSFGEPVARLRSIPTVDNGEPLVSLAELCPKLPLLPGRLPYLRECLDLLEREATDAQVQARYVRLSPDEVEAQTEQMAARVGAHLQRMGEFQEIGKAS